MTFDDLIAKDDAIPLSTTFYDHQPHINPFMRGFACHVLCDMALDEGMRIKMDTYFLATTLLDRYLAITPVSTHELYLFGAASLVAASKYEEIYTLRLEALCARNRNIFNVDMLLNAEATLLLTLQFRVSVANISTLAHTMIVDQDPPASPKQRQLLLYLLTTLSLQTYYGQYRQSLLAAAAVYISRVAFAIPTGEPNTAVRDTLPLVLAAVEENKNPAVQFGCALRETFAQPRFGG
ncbi:uncharacterized protein LOC126766975, partial [Bactrocera neohumeralis]|uniref:uncharacterized protein LOC126766975 n=1 Tax=Bactrocera neohumeralis TaxID=98809 RepID=UPI002165E605